MFLLFAVFGWGLTWPINKVILESMSPFWMATFRSAIATLVLLAIALPRGRLVVPTRADMPVLLSITLLHMVGFAVLAMIGLQLVPVGRSVVLAYTTPLWVMPGAALLLGGAGADCGRSHAGYHRRTSAHRRQAVAGNPCRAQWDGPLLT